MVTFSKVMSGVGLECDAAGHGCAVGFNEHAQQVLNARLVGVEIDQRSLAFPSWRSGDAAFEDDMCLQEIGVDAFQKCVAVSGVDVSGEIATEGRFGVWDQSDPGQTTISGDYTFDHADLAIYHGVSGILSSQGKFGGTLRHIDISGKTDTPDFAVKSGRHPMRH